MKRYFIYTDEKSNKFWSIEIVGNSFTVNYGKTGSAGQTQTKTFADEATCKKEADKLIAEKLKKGYAEQIQANEKTEKPVTNAKSTTSAKKPDSGEQAQNAKELLDEINIKITEPVSLSEIKKAEKKLKIKLPPSYVDFVTRYGTFEIDGDITGRGSGNTTYLFNPDFLVEKTLDLRDELLDEDFPIEDDERKIIADGLFFCADPMDEFYYVFVISSADESGEMKVRTYDYQNPGMNDPWHNGNMTFESAIAEIVEIIKNNKSDKQTKNKIQPNQPDDDENKKAGKFNDESFIAISKEITKQEAEKKYKISDYLNFGEDDDDDDEDEDDDDEKFTDLTIEFDSSKQDFIFPDLSKLPKIKNLSIDGQCLCLDDDEDDDGGEKIGIHVYHGDLHIPSLNTGTLESGCVLIVDGNLTVDDYINCYDEYGGNLLLVTGNVKCRNLFMNGCPKVVIQKDLTAFHGILGRYGDDGGVLTVQGNTKANIILSDTYFNMYFAKQPDAVVIVTNGDADCEADYDDDASLKAVLPQYIDEDNRLDCDAIADAFIDGKSILRPTAMTTAQKMNNRLNELLKNADNIKTLTIDEHKCSKIPHRVFEFPHLIELNLARHTISELPSDIDKLKHLEKLDLQYNSLRDFPEEITKLPLLKSLDIRNNHFSDIPEIIGRITSLEELYIEDFTTLPDNLANLTNLKKLYICRGRASDLSLNVIGKLNRLTDLTLELLPVSDYSDILNLKELTCLTIKFNSSPQNFIFPDLSKLPKLKNLSIDGYCLNTVDFSKLPIWNIHTLESLILNSFNDKAGKPGRIGCLTLPDAFDNLPNLKTVSIQPSDKMDKLPDSFFRLKNLKDVKIKTAKLSAETIANIRKTFPQGVTFNIEHCSDNINNPDSNWQKVHAFTKEGADFMYREDYEKALNSYEKALNLCTKNSCYYDFDRLYSLYGRVYCLSTMVNACKDKKKDKLITELISYAEQALEYAPRPGSIWIFTQEGAFHQEVNRFCGNTLAWFLLQQGKPESALAAVERAVECISQYGHYFIYDTQVRALLQLGRVHDAFLIVDRILAKHPDFSDFQDIKADAAFIQWQAENTFGQ